MESAHGLNPTTGEGLASIGQHPHRFQFAVDLQHPQIARADCHNSDGVRVEGIGLAVVAGVEEPYLCGELGRHIDDLLAGLE